MTDEPRCRWNGPTSARVLPGRHGAECGASVTPAFGWPHSWCIRPAGHNGLHCDGNYEWETR